MRIKILFSIFLSLFLMVLFHLRVEPNFHLVNVGNRDFLSNLQMIPVLLTAYSGSLPPGGGPATIHFSCRLLDPIIFTTCE